MSEQERTHRPWGSFEVLETRSTHQMKRLLVLPGQQLSYQSHRFRAEHWVVVEGTAAVCLNDVWLKVDAQESIFIPKGAKHRLRNPSADQVLQVIEVQVGDSFEESDIIRFEDDYARVTQLTSSLP
jgi:mannose-1-phosphate guanylyltransferase / mannose-6-phosphate isomerase